MKVTRRSSSDEIARAILEVAFRPGGSLPRPPNYWQRKRLDVHATITRIRNLLAACPPSDIRTRAMLAALKQSITTWRRVTEGQWDTVERAAAHIQAGSPVPVVVEDADAAAPATAD